MSYVKVEDSSIIDQLNKQSSKPVTDPAILQQLNQAPDDNEFFNMPEPEGFFAKLPRNVLAGLGQFQRNLFNIPHDLAQSVEQEGNQLLSLLPQREGMPSLQNYQLNQGISDVIPHQPEFDYAKFFGQQGEGTLMDQLIQKGVEHLPEIAAGASLLRAAMPRFPITKKMGTKKLENVSSSIADLGINPTRINPSLLAEAESYLPKTRASQEMLHNAYTGDYPNAFGLQSQVNKHARNLSKSPLAAERLQAPQVSELVDLIKEDMYSGLMKHGLHKEADMLKEGLNDYRKYIKFREAVVPKLKKLGIPVTGVALLGLGYKKGKQLLTD